MGWGSRQTCVWGWSTAPCSDAGTVFGEKAVGGKGWAMGRREARQDNTGRTLSLILMRFDAPGRCLKDLAHVSEDHH